MRTTALLTTVIATVLTTTAVAAPPVPGGMSSGLAVTTTTPHVNPPLRPAALTPAQYNALRLMQAMPEHSIALNTSATYSAHEKHIKCTRFSDDALTLVYDIGWPGFYLALLLCAMA